MSGDRLEKTIEFLEQELGAGYDWLEDLSFVVPVRGDPTAFNCVELSLDAGYRSGLIPRNLSPNDITPLDLSKFFDSIRGEAFGWRRILEWK